MGYETEISEVIGPSGKTFKIRENSSGSLVAEINGDYRTTGNPLASYAVNGSGTVIAFNNPDGGGGYIEAPIVQYDALSQPIGISTDGGTTIIGLPITIALCRTPRIIVGLSGATYSQTGTAVTVTWTSHGMTSALNGSDVYLVQSTGSLTTGWFTNFTYVDANSFTCTSSVSQSTSGNLGTNTSETTISSYTMAADRLGINGTARVLGSTNCSTAGGNTKRISLYLSSTELGYVNPTSLAGGGIAFGFSNQGSAAVQCGQQAMGQWGPGASAAAASGTVDTTVSQTIAIKGKLANAADYLALMTADLVITHIN